MNNLSRSLGVSALASLLALNAQAQPANDQFANRITLTGPAVTTAGTNVGATTEAGEPTGSGFARFGASVWWTWTAPASGSTRMDTFGSTFNTVLGVYTGDAVGSLTQVALNDNAPGRSDVSLVTFNAQQGTPYQIQVSGAQGFGPGGIIATGAVQLTIGMPPAVSITAPTNNIVFTEGSNIFVTATATSTVGTVSRVDFYRAGSLVGTALEAPYTAAVTNSPPGSNSLFAVVTDTTGQVATSAVVRVLVASVGITIVSPADGTTFANTNPISVSVFTNLPSGAITNVQFFVNGQKFGEDSTAPFSAAWTNVAGGSHRLTATAMDDAGNSYSAAPVNIAVPRYLVTRGSVWKYLDNGSDQGTNWYARGFDDDSWASGPAQLGYGDGDEATVVNSGPTNNYYITTYFRRAFTVSNAAGFVGLQLNVQRDDGAVVYLNGVEAARFNMNPGPVTYTTLAPNAADDGAGFVAGTAPIGLLVEGINVLAVEIHQSGPTSSDISFDLELLGLPPIIRNQFPAVALTTPPDGTTFLAPSSIALSATASDMDGTITNVEFFSGNVKIGEDATEPYSAAWNNPPIGPHVLRAVATDDQGGAQPSAPVNIVVYDATGTPFAAITAPRDGTVVEGPTNLLVTAYASALAGVTNVQFLANGAAVGDDATSPYSIVWAAPFGSSALTAIGSDANGRRGTAAVVNVTITIPPTNTVPPKIFTQSPLADSTITNLTSIQVAFTERVIGVDAADLLVNDVPATSVSGVTSNYVFSFAQPPYGPVRVRFAPNHGITDFGWPTNLVFYENDPEASWTYDLIDKTPPTIVAKTPAAGASLTNLTQISVTFSEPVAGLDASDFLVSGTPAYAVSGSGTNFTFSVSQPASGTVNISWATNHGITDLANVPNAFNRTGPGATWTYTLDAKTILFPSNALWLFVKGTNEASSPTNAWRQPGFDDSGWSNAPAPFFFGDPYSNGVPAYTHLTDMRSNYTCIYLRKSFVVPNAAKVTNLFLRAQIDDGMIVWINGTEVLRTNVAAGEIPYTGTALSASMEFNGAPYTNYRLLDPRSYLLSGTNVIAVHALNESIAQSSDFGFNAELFTYQSDTEAVAPRVVREEPAAGYVLALTNVIVTFNEPVTNVNAADLLVNGVPAADLALGSNNTFNFSFPQPPFGPVAITWAANHGIVDLDFTPKPFDTAAPGATWQYVLLNANSPYLLAVAPTADTTVDHLTQIAVIFSEGVTGVDAADLLVNGVPATSVTGSDFHYIFTFPQPAYGLVLITWASSHGIQDLNQPPVAFDPSWPDHSWTYLLVDQTPPAIAAQDPSAGSVVLNLSQITVSFTEPVSGVSARDLLINGQPAGSVTGTNETYTFTFPQPNASVVRVTWAASHGIRDLATVPNSFDANGPGATWSYATIDNVAPRLVTVDPPPFTTARSLRHVKVTFDEPVAGVDASDLLLNGSAALQVVGTGAGPYNFTFAQPAAGPVQLTWVSAPGIRDLVTPPNNFGGDSWSYMLDPTIASDFAVQHVVHISLDGAGAAYIESYANSAPGQFANFVRLQEEGAWTLNARCDYDISVTLPNHASMFTGRPVLQPAGWANTTHHGLTIDSDNGTTIHDPRTGNPNVPYKYSVFDVAHDHGLSTAFLTSKQSLTLFMRSWDGAHGTADLIGPDNGSNKLDFTFNTTTPGSSFGPTAPVVDEFINRVETNALWNFTFLHFDDGDATGHASGWGSAAYSNALMNADRQIGRVLDAINASPTLSNNTVVIITADHGGSGAGHFDATALNTYRLPLFLWGTGIPAGADLYSMFGNRADPGMSRPSYSDPTVLQPLRNGDVGNLAVTLLGLPSIPGSTILPILGPVVPLTITRSGATLTVSWPVTEDDYALETATTLGSSLGWQPVSDGIVTIGARKYFTVTPSANNPVQFFRLHKN